MSKRSRSRSSSPSRAEQPQPKARKVEVTRLYVLESCYGEEPQFLLYHATDPERSRRVHAAIKTLHALSETKSQCFAATLLDILSRGTWDVDALAKEKIPAKQRVPGFGVTTLAPIVEQLKSIGLDGADQDEFEDVVDEYDEGPMSSMLRVNVNY